MCCNLKGTYLLSELAGQTDAVIKISLFLRAMQGNDSFSENFEKRLLLRFQNDRSGWPALTFDKRPYSLEAELETGSLLCRMALWDCFVRRIWPQFLAQLRYRQ